MYLKTVEVLGASMSQNENKNVDSTEIASTTPSPSTGAIRVIGVAEKTIAFSLMVLLIVIFSFALVEVTGRVSAASEIERRIQAANGELASRVAGITTRQKLAVPDYSRRDSLVSNEQVIQELKDVNALLFAGLQDYESRHDELANRTRNATYEKERMEALRARLRVLDLSGDFVMTNGRSNTLCQINAELVQWGVVESVPKNPCVVNKADFSGFIDALIWRPLTELEDAIASARMEMLLILCSVCAAAMGALLAGFRNDDPTSIKNFCVGAMSGVLVYLGLKGGKFLFTLQGGDSAAGLNPYGIAFSAFLVGLFTEFAYKFLVRIVTRFQESLLDPGAKK